MGNILKNTNFNVMKYQLPIFILFLLSIAGFSQTVLLEQDVTKDTLPRTYGPNLRNFRHFYYSFGFVAGGSENKNLEINYGRSIEAAIGYRYKRKINNFYSFGWNMNCNIKNFNIRENAFKIFPNPAIHYKEKLITRNLALEVYNRFNFDTKRGDFIGNFIDIGAFAEWNFFPTEVTIDNYNFANGSLAGNTKQIHSDLAYINYFNYGINVDLGFNRYVIYCSYRLSNIFNNTIVFPELPRIIVGLQVGLHQ